MLSASQIPLSLYIHIPWCIRKCPYCDFNSHEPSGRSLPESAYLDALLLDIDHDIELFPSIAKRQVVTVFIGGGTPSLMSAEFYQQLFDQLNRRINLAANAEITMEANPGTWEQANFAGFRSAGINRLSIGVQSFNHTHLEKLGRIHDSEMAAQTFHAAREAGFDNINIDLMHTLPDQTISQALDDLMQAAELDPEHLSWYQLTIEKNTAFYKRPPALPEEDTQWQILQEGQAFLANSGYQQYEVSAYAKRGSCARHNLNYWRFADYIGIGAGAHGKLSLDDEIVRTRKSRVPVDYMANAGTTVHSTSVQQDELPLEFMMNACRLNEGFALSLFEQRTGLQTQLLMKNLETLASNGLIDESVLINKRHFLPTKKGRLFVNELVASFLE